MKTRRLTIAGMLLGLVIVVQLIGRSYPDITRNFVGPIINLILILCAWYSGNKYGLLMATLTPLMAWLTGQLNPVMAPFIPFIMVSNLLFVLGFILFKHTTVKRAIGIALGSVLKYAFLLGSVTYVVPRLNLGIPAPVQKNMVVAFGTVQLIAALVGGYLAILIIEALRKRKIDA